MEEKRRHKRLPVNLRLDVSSLFKQDNVKVEDIHAPIEVIDVSKSGIGFRSSSILPIGYYFNARIQLGRPDNGLYCVIRILRSQLCSDGIYQYGCEFVGMAAVLYYIFDEYEKFLTETEQGELEEKNSDKEP